MNDKTRDDTKERQMERRRRIWFNTMNVSIMMVWYEDALDSDLNGKDGTGKQRNDENEIHPMLYCRESCLFSPFCIPVYSFVLSRILATSQPRPGPNPNPAS